MVDGWTRRRALAAGGGAVVVAAAAALRKLPFPGPGTTATSAVLRIDEADPAAVPLFILPTPTATSTPSPTSTPTAVPTLTPTPTPLAARRPRWEADLLRQVVRTGPTDRPRVALTIDDGWSARDAVLGVLQEKRVQLSLFLTGRAIPNDRGFVARALNAGCEVANHTMDHYDLTKMAGETIRKDIQDFEDLVKAVVPAATTVPFMRPSGGALNQTVIDVSVALGYRPILWSASVGDGSASTTPADMVRNGLAGAKPGAIILMHFSDRAVAALPGLIDGIRARGLEPVSLSRLFEPVPS
ncbi:MAG: polysaccharide deacetylase family protein [Chloroflexi bacterium]|nr:polysaccharide deacetylase family protein [Chloroflexota bacterium]